MRHPVFYVFAISALALSHAVSAQTFAVANSDRSPRFLLASDSDVIPIDVGRTPLLGQRLSLDLDGATLKQALEEIERQSGLPLVYSDDVLPSDSRVRLRAQTITLAAALTDVLYDAGVDVVFDANGRAALVKRPAPAPGTEQFAEAVQTGTIAGTVMGTDAGLLRPVARAQVTVEGTGLGSLADAEGRYRILNVPAGTRSVTASSIGYGAASQEVEVSDGATVTADFTLEVSPTTLSELVVTVTGEQRRVELGHVVGRIQVDSVVREAPVNSLTDLISGRMAGVQVLHNSGLAGSTPRIRIRGLSSANLSNDAIVVVDGVRVDNSTGPMTGTGNALRGGRLNDLNPEEIESLEIAKGPSAATLYGTDAANGVVVITTRRGREGPAQWRAWMEQGWASKAVDRFPDNYIAWGHTETDPTARRCTMQDVAGGLCVGIDSVGSFNPLNDPETTPFTTGHRQTYGLQVSGGSDRLTYLFSGDLSDEDGYVRMPRAEAERFESIHGPGTLDPDFLRPNTQRKVSLRANVSAPIDERAELSARVNYVRNNSLFAADQTGGGVVTAAARGPGFRDAQNGYGGGRLAPAQSFATKREETVDRFLGSLSGQWTPASWLDTRGTVGLDHISSDRSGLSRAGEGEIETGTLHHVLLRTTTYTADLGAIATAPLSSRLISATSAGVQYNRRDEAQLFSQVTNLPPGSSGRGQLTGASSRSERDESYVLGAYVQQQLSLNERLFLIGAVRGDGGSAFGDDVTLAAYPKASLSWLVSEESFMPRWRGLTNLRLRAAWGASGVQPRRTDVIPGFQFGSAVVDGQVVPSALQSTIGNADLEPERQREVELGLDAELLGGRVSLEATYYNRVSKDALINVPALPSNGTFSRFENLGSVRNRGFEGGARVTVVDVQPLRWDVSVAGSHNSNRLVELAPGVPTLAPASRYVHAPGFPLWGIWERPFSYEDTNGDGVITAAEVQLGDTAVFVGSSIPTRELAVASTISLFDRRVRVATQFDHRGGHVRPDNDETARCASSSRTCRGLNDPTATLDEQARAVATSQGIVPVHDASFVRLRELSVTYVASADLARRFGGRSVSVTLGARNLALWSDYPGADPEGSTALFSNAGSDAFGDSGSFPQARSWTVRVQIGN